MELLGRQRLSVHGSLRWSILFLGIVLAASASAQQQPQSPSHPVDGDIPVMRVTSQYVMLDVLVGSKKSGNPIGDLEAKDFVIEEDGKPQAVTYCSHDRLPLSVVFLFDLTESVQPILKPLAEGALEVLGHLKPQDQVSIMVFSSHTEVLQDFTTDHALAAAAIGKASEMKSKEGTFIHEDMYEAVEQALKATPADSRRVMVWLTDGTANFTNAATRKMVGKEAPRRLHTKTEAMDSLMHSGVVVAALIDRSAMTDTIVFAADLNPLTMMFGARLGDINRYADITGGPVLKTTKKEIAAKLGQLIDELRSRYTIGYKPSDQKPAGTFSKVRVTLSPEVYKARTDLRKPEVFVRSRSGYYR